MTQDYTNCFAWRTTNCSALKEKLCGKRECPFYKPKDEVNNITIELAIHNYLATLGLFKERNHQIYE